MIGRAIDRYYHRNVMFVFAQGNARNSDYCSHTIAGMSYWQKMFGRKLRELRKARGLTQDELAELAAIHKIT